MMSIEMSKEESRSTGMEAVAGNDDLLTQILLRLPVRSLLRFKSVSKHWLSLISNPQFYMLKSKRCCKHISGILLKSRKLRFVPLDQDDYPAPLERLDFVGAEETNLDVIQSCNGLLLCQTKQDSSTETKCYIINLTTKQHSVVSLGLGYHSVGLAFDPKKSPHFKLICLFLGGYHDSVAYSVWIYSSETALITQLSDIFCPSIDFALPSGIYWNGAINWINYRGDGLYFNVDEERFGILPVPPAQYNYGISYCGESNDHLFLAHNDIPPETPLDVHEMDRDYSGWFVRFRVDLRPMFRAFPTGFAYLPGAYGVLAIVDNDDENPFIVFSRPGIAIRFHLKDRIFTKICDLNVVDGPGYFPLWVQSIQFIESLHPL